MQMQTMEVTQRGPLPLTRSVLLCPLDKKRSGCGPERRRHCGSSRLWPDSAGSGEAETRTPRTTPAAQEGGVWGKSGALGEAGDARQGVEVASVLACPPQR